MASLIGPVFGRAGISLFGEFLLMRVVCEHSEDSRERNVESHPCTLSFMLQSSLGVSDLSCALVFAWTLRAREGQQVC